MGHAEASCGQGLVDRIGRWIEAAVAPGQVTAARGGAAAHPGEDPSGQAPPRQAPSDQVPLTHDVTEPTPNAAA
jgi:hypothetical protein